MLIRPAALMLFLTVCALTAQAGDWEFESVETEVGIHVISGMGETQQLISSEISEDVVSRTLRELDWPHGFYQVFVVRSRGVSMEVGGSLDAEHGLSAMYRNRGEHVEAVIVVPPASISDLERILLSFARGDDDWKDEYEFRFRLHSEEPEKSLP